MSPACCRSRHRRSPPYPRGTRSRPSRRRPDARSQTAQRLLIAINPALLRPHCVLPAAQTPNTPGIIPIIPGILPITDPRRLHTMSRSLRPARPRRSACTLRRNFRPRLGEADPRHHRRTHRGDPRARRRRTALYTFNDQNTTEDLLTALDQKGISVSSFPPQPPPRRWPPSTDHATTKENHA